MSADTGKTGWNATNPREGVVSGTARNDFLPGILVTLGLIAAIETLASTAFNIPNAGVVLLLAVAYAAFTGGTRSGLASAVTVSIYMAWNFSVSGELFRYSTFNLNRLMVLLIAAPAMALMVGALRHRSRLYAEMAITNATLQARIAERTRAHDALQESRERLRRSQTHANIGTWDWNIQTGDLYWSERIGPLFGYAEGELETTYENFLNAVHSEDRQFVVDSVDACVNDGAVYDIEHRIVWPDGTVRWVHERGDVVRAEDGTSLRMLGVVQDVTGRKTIETALKESEEKYRAIIGSVAEGIISVDEKLRIVLFNPAAERMFGYAGERVTGQPLDILIPERFRAQHDEHIREFAVTGQANRGMGRYGLIYGVRASGEEFPIEATISRSGTSPNRLFTVILRDVTERTQMEDALRESEARFRQLAEEERLAYAVRQRDALVREVHHRIKNNLQAVAGLLMRDTNDHPELKPLLLTAIGHVQMIAVVHGIQAEADARGITLCEMTQSIARVVTGLTQRGIRLCFNAETSCPAQINEKDAVPVALILNELLVNAVKHSRDKRDADSVEVDISRDGDAVLVKISNPGELPPGFDVAAGTGTGTGLGLVRSLMPRHGAGLIVRGVGDGVDAVLKLGAPVIDAWTSVRVPSSPSRESP